MNVCFAGTFEKNYPRNQILEKAMRRAGIHIVTCHVDLWKRDVHKTHFIKNPFFFIIIVLRLLIAYTILCVKYLFSPKHDLLLVGFPGHLDLVILRPLALLRGVPIIFDVFISLYDAAVDDRQLVSEKSFFAFIFKWLDKQSCKLANKVILDTQANIRYFETNYKLSKSIFTRVFAGADDEVFIKSTAQKMIRSADQYHVLFCGKFTPFHGVQTIINAAEMLSSDNAVHFDLIGTGQQFDMIQSDIQKKGLTNVTCHGWQPYESLTSWFHKADLCLGAFGKVGKLDRVIPNKIFQAMACGKAIITSQSNAVQELLKDMDSVYFVPPESPKELAIAIAALKNNPALTEKLSQEAHAVFKIEASLERIGRELKHVVENTIRTS